MHVKYSLSALAASAVSIIAVSSGTPVDAQATYETFSTGGVSLNTNNNFRRFDGQPRVSIYRSSATDPDQQFERLTGNRGGVLLRNRSTGKCLNAHYLANGSEINTWPCDGNDVDQNWNLVNVGGSFLLQRSGTNSCVDTPTRDNAGKVHLWTCDRNNANQRWTSSRGGPSVGGGTDVGTNATAESFFRSVIGQVGIARRDRSDLNGQCVSLIARYIQDVFLPPAQRSVRRAFGDGKDTARVVSQMFPNNFSPTTTAGLPRRGAIISFPQIGVIGGVTYGHVAIVVESRQLASGQRQVRIMDSNGDSRGAGSTVREYSYWINIPDGTAQRYGSGIYWTNPK